MTDNIYSPPKADLNSTTETKEFYVVSMKKFYILFLLSLGLYSFYVFYKHWRLYSNYHSEDIYPVARSIFQVFFTHSLARKIEDSIQNSNITYQWKSSFAATIYVVFTIVGNILDRLSGKEIGSPYTDMAFLVYLPILAWAFGIIQKAANIACHDAEGQSNHTMTPINLFWCVIGTIFWILILLGLYSYVDPTLFESAGY